VNLSTRFSPGYIDSVFSLWYSQGKPKAATLVHMVSVDPIAESKPAVTTLHTWLGHDEWKARTEAWDHEITKSVRNKSLAATVAMMERHAKIGKEMQDIAIDWIRENRYDLGPGTAVRLLVEGIAMEQETASIPDMLNKLRKMDDEKLLNEIAQAQADSPSQVHANN